MRESDFEFPGGGTSDGLLDALAARWTAEGNQDLVAMIPALREIAAAMRQEVIESDGNVSVLCYTMF